MALDEWELLNSDVCFNSVTRNSWKSSDAARCLKNYHCLAYANSCRTIRLFLMTLSDLQKVIVIINESYSGKYSREKFFTNAQVRAFREAAFSAHLCQLKQLFADKIFANSLWFVKISCCTVGTTISKWFHETNTGSLLNLHAQYFVSARHHS